MIERMGEVGLIHEFKASPEFFQICIEIRRRLVTQSLKRDWLQRRIEQWIERRSEASISAQEKSELYKKLYILAMEAISERSYMVDIEHGSEAERGSEAEVESSFAKEDSKRGQQAYLRDIFAQKAISPSEAYHAVDYLFESELEAPTELKSDTAYSYAFSQTVSTSSNCDVIDNMRYQSIPFAQGFYVLDRETGKTWFVKAGSSQMVSCTLPVSESTQALPLPTPLLAAPVEQLSESERSESKPAEFIPERSESKPAEFIPERSESWVPEVMTLLSPSSTSGTFSKGPPVALESVELTSQALTPLSEEPPRFASLHEMILRRYPYPIAHLYRTFLAEQDPRLRLQLLVLVFHQTLKYAAFPLVQQFLQDPRLNDTATYQAIARTLSSSWGAWLDLLRCANESMDEYSTPLTASILKTYRRLEVERPLEERFLYTQRFLDPFGEERVTYLQLGLLEAMILFRDSFVHGFTPSVQQAEEDLCVYGPLLSEIVEEMSWMVEYPLYYAWKQREDGSHLAIPLMGCDPSFDAPHIEIPPGQILSDRPSFFISEPGTPVSLLPLFPLLLADDVVPGEPTLPDQSHALYLLDGCSGAQLIFHNLWQTPSIRTTGASWLRRHLRNKRFGPPHRELSAHLLFQQTTRWTLYQLDRLTQHQQYFPELVVSRTHVEQCLQDFLVSQHLLFVLHGGFGVGKTTLLAQLTQQQLSEEQPVVWLSGIELLSQGFLEVLAQVMGLRPLEEPPGTEEIARYLSPHLGQETPLLVVLDNIDCVKHLSSLMDEVDQTIASFAATSLHDRIKFVVSLQSEQLWQLQRRGQWLGHSRAFAMTFDDRHLQLREPSMACELAPLCDEELAWAYERYRSFDNGHGIEPFCPQTRWSGMAADSSTRNLLRYPQLLRLTLATFCGQELPETLEVESLMEYLVVHVIEERYASLPIPERLQFLRSLSELFIQHQTDYLSREQLLLSNNSQIVRALQNPHSDSPLVQLFHLGILSETWIDGECWIRFSSPLAHSYFLAQAWIEQASLRGPSFMMPSFDGQSLPYPLSRSYLFVWLHLLGTEHLPFFSSWVHENFAVLGSWIEEFLLFSIRVKSGGWLMFVNELLADPSEDLYQCLLRTTDRLWNSQDEVEALKLLETLSLHNEKLGRIDHLQPEILYRRARLCEVLGRNEEALHIYEEARFLAESLGHRLILAPIFVRLSEFSRTSHRYEEAMSRLAYAQEQLEEGDRSRRLAHVIREQGHLAYELGELPRALLCYQQSLSISEECGNSREIAASLSRLGTVFGAQGDFENALSHYYRCLRVSQRLGDRQSMAATLHNIGIILKSQRDNDEAVKVFVQALRLRKSLGLFRESIASLHHISVIREEQGNVEEALDFLQDCLVLQRENGDTSGEVETLLHMGHKLHRYGRVK